MIPQRSPQYPFIPEVSLEVVSNVLAVPGLMTPSGLKRPSRTCHTSVDWTRYWVERMVKEMKARAYPLLAQEQYADTLDDFLSRNPGAPSKLGPDKIGGYLRDGHGTRGMGAPSEQVVLEALCFFYEHVLKAPKCLYGIPRKAKEEKTARILPWKSTDELMDGFANAGQRLIGTLITGFGFKISELVRMRLSDLEGSLMHIRNGKGGKSRSVPIPVSLQQQILEYRKWANPVVYLFEGKRAGKSLTKQDMQASFEKVVGQRRPANKLWIPTRGADLRFTQAYLGHQCG